MRGFVRSRSGRAACWTTLLALLLTTIGLVAVTHRRVAAQPPPKVIEGTSSNQWVPGAVQVGKGDRIQWRIKGGKHGIVFGPVFCDTAKKHLKFSPPLDGCRSGVFEEPGKVIVEAEVVEPLTADLHYHCQIHGNMSGKVQPTK